MAAATSVYRIVKCCRFHGFSALQILPSIRNDFFVQQRTFFVGAKALKPRKRYEWRRDRKPANTQLLTDAEEVFEKRRTFGGGSKVKAVTKSSGSYILKSQGLELDVPILDVVYSGSRKEHVVKKIMTKGTVVQLDATEFRNRLEKLFLKQMENSDDTITDSTTSQSDTSDSTEKSHSTNMIDEELLELLKAGNLYGRITTRPGQVGLCDGYVLEGPELQQVMEKLSANK